MQLVLHPSSLVLCSVHHSRHAQLYRSSLLTDFPAWCEDQKSLRYSITLSSEATDTKMALRIMRSTRSLLPRGLTCHPYPHRSSFPMISTAVVSANPDGLNLKIPSLNTTFPYRWLRDACTCPSCVHTSTQQKLHRTSDIPASRIPASVQTADDGVHVSWASPDRHRFFFPRAFLAANVSPMALSSFHNDIPTTLWPMLPYKDKV